MSRTDIRLALPSKGRLQQSTLEFLSHCGFDVRVSSTRGYIGSITALPDVTVLFQRPRDIVSSVANGGVDFGITGYDVVTEANVARSVRVIHDALGYGKCRLVVAVPESWSDVKTVADLRARSSTSALRVASVFPHLTEKFLRSHDIAHTIIEAEGSLEVMPEIGAADIICDLVETGTTLQQNRLRMLTDGVILNTQSVLIANQQSLQREPVMRTAELLLEHIEAHLRAQGYVMIVANVRGESFEAVGKLLTERTTLGGLQGPTVAPIYPNPKNAETNQEAHWFSVTIVARRAELSDAINQLRSIGGSGVIVTPITYIFEELPPRVVALRAP